MTYSESFPTEMIWGESTNQHSFNLPATRRSSLRDRRKQMDQENEKVHMTSFAVRLWFKSLVTGKVSQDRHSSLAFSNPLLKSSFILDINIYKRAKKF